MLARTKLRLEMGILKAHTHTEKNNKKTSCDEKRTRAYSCMECFSLLATQDFFTHSTDTHAHSPIESTIILLLKMIGFAFFFLFGRYSHFDLIAFNIYCIVVLVLVVFLLVCWHIACASFVRSFDCCSQSFD